MPHLDVWSGSFTYIAPKTFKSLSVLSRILISVRWKCFCQSDSQSCTEDSELGLCSIVQYALSVQPRHLPGQTAARYIQQEAT
jgi:hypothetical protein